ncbi:MAG TPA: hypothetical protein VIV11_30385 [Kofleriaceae bacterium]
MSGPVVAVIGGLGIAGGSDQPPGLVDASLQFSSHVEGVVAADRDAPIAAGLSVMFATGSYDNTQPPPSFTSNPDERISFRRGGIGLVIEGRLPLGPVHLVAGAAPYLVLTEAKASAIVQPVLIPADYFSESDVSVGAEVRAGVDVRVDARALVGVRGGWTWYSAHLGAAGGGTFGGPWAELRIAVEFDTLSR